MHVRHIHASFLCTFLNSTDYSNPQLSFTNSFSTITCVQALITVLSGMVFYVQVNTQDLQEECQILGVERLPYFKIWAGGKVTHSFSCNLTTINELRRALSEAAPIHRPRTLFRTPSITEMPPLTGAPAGGLPGERRSGAAPAEEPMHRPSRSRSGGPPGAVRGSGPSRMPSIDDLVRGRGSGTQKPEAKSESSSEGGPTDSPAGKGGSKA